MSTHDQFRAMFEDYEARRLSDHDVERLESHLYRCQECYDALTAFRVAAVQAIGQKHAPVIKQIIDELDSTNVSHRLQNLVGAATSTIDNVSEILLSFFQSLLGAGGIPQLAPAVTRSGGAPKQRGTAQANPHEWVEKLVQYGSVVCDLPGLRRLTISLDQRNLNYFVFSNMVLEGGKTVCKLMIVTRADRDDEDVVTVLKPDVGGFIVAPIRLFTGDVDLIWSATN